MDTKEQQAFIKEFKKFSKEISSSKEKSQNFLKKAGIHTKTGRLTKPYRNTIIQK